MSAQSWHAHYVDGNQEQAKSRFADANRAIKLARDFGTARRSDGKFRDASVTDPNGTVIAAWKNGKRTR